ERDAAAAGLLAGGELVALADAWISRSAFAVLALRLEAALARLHASAPLRPGLPRAEARSLVGLGQKRFEALVAALAAEGRIAERRSALALPGHRPALTPAQERAWAAARQDIASAPLQPPSLRELEERHGLGGDVVAALVDRGELVRVGGDAAFLAPAVLAFGERVVEELAAVRTITVARARDLTGSSRKHVLPLLLFLDDHGVTRRVGDDRVLIHDPPEARARLARAIQRPEEAP
ncbi:MAG TPA: SelB C-terminal domain-containing protein, partial [Candidatus Limnocylindrales bacterium]|nr:SelB C-terminal domain-containing protein [Candidatus Limnocylindrales bacterium]